MRKNESNKISMTEKLSETNEKEIKDKKRELPKILFTILVVALVGFAGWSYWQYSELKKEKDLATNPELQAKIAQKEMQKVLTLVKKHMIVPEGEEPQLATIVDAEEVIKQQPFFEGAVDGDKVLIFVNARRAVVYSPSRDLIVNAGPVFSDENQGGEINPTPVKETSNTTKTSN